MTTMKTISPSDISTPLLTEMIHEQLQAWPLAADNYAQLGKADRRRFRIGALEGFVQCNPRRMVSTGADVSKESISRRTCFLCDRNRPKEQFALPFNPEGSEGRQWDILVNPFPILPVHFTVAAKDHAPQNAVPLDMVALAERVPGLVCFYNGAQAGASAPDHLHFQMVLKEELPLIRYLESGAAPSELPYHVDYQIITPDMEGMLKLASFAEADRDGKLNAFAWIGDDSLMRTAVVPRSAHRPACYFRPDGEGRLLCSPGAIDMAGIIVLPRHEDFEKITDEDIAQIWRETALLS